jgi:hypothetical protein
MQDSPVPRKHALVVRGLDEHGTPKTLTISWDGSITVESPSSSDTDSGSPTDAQAVDELAAALKIIDDLRGMLRDKDAIIDALRKDLAAERTSSAVRREESSEWRRQVEAVVAQREAARDDLATAASNLAGARERLRLILGRHPLASGAMDDLLTGVEQEVATLRGEKSESERWREELAALPLRERVVRCGAKDCMVFIEGNRATVVVELRLDGESLADIERRVRATLPATFQREYVFRELRPTAPAKTRRRDDSSLVHVARGEDDGFVATGPNGATSQRPSLEEALRNLAEAASVSLPGD